MKLMGKKTIVNLPLNTKIVIWKNSKSVYRIFLYNDTKFFKFNIDVSKSFLQYDYWTHSFDLGKTKLSVDWIKFNKMLFKFLKSWDSYFYSKIKFKGKGFRIRFFKKNKFVKFFFGRSHKTFIFFKKIKLKRLSKYKFLIKNLKESVVNKNSSLVVKIKPLNVYTLRGLRRSKQIVFKRKGKKGTYI